MIKVLNFGPLGAVNDEIGCLITQTGLHGPHKWLKQGVDVHLWSSYKSLKASDGALQLDLPGSPQGNHP
jgi:hypothetical protein